MSKAIEKFVSPKGELRWVTIVGEGVENMSGNLQYKADLVIADEEVKKAFKAKVDAFWEANKPANFKKKPKSLGYMPCEKMLDDGGNPIKDEEDKYVYDQDGPIAISFKTATTFPDGKTKKVRVRNAKSALVELGDKTIGNGSIGYIAGAMGIYTNTVKGMVMDAGVTFYLDEIKITKFVERTAANPFGSADEEDEADAWTGEDEDTFAGVAEAEEAAKPRL